MRTGSRMTGNRSESGGRSERKGNTTGRSRRVSGIITRRRDERESGERRQRIRNEEGEMQQETRPVRFRKPYSEGRSGAGNERRFGRSSSPERGNFRQSKPDRRRNEEEGGSFRRRNEDSGGGRPFRRNSEDSVGGRPFRRNSEDSGEGRPFRKSREFQGERKPYRTEGDNRQRQGTFRREGDFRRKREPGNEDTGRSFSGTGNRRSFQKPSERISERGGYRRREDRISRGSQDGSSYERQPKRSGGGSRFYKLEEGKTADNFGMPDQEGKSRTKKRFSDSGTSEPKPEKRANLTGEIRLNRYISNAGICSRREADKYIEAGVVTINGVVCTELGTRVKPGEEVRFDGRLLNPEKKVYLLLNKPKDYVTTTDDPHAEATVMDLIKDACPERIYPVGRLDKNTTGLLFFTNDGELSKKLSHPSSKIEKVYQVTLDKPLTKNHMIEISEGIELEDGLIAADAISYIDQEKKEEIGIEIHSGKNRIVRRIFEHLGYKIKKLDRVSFAGLTKKKLARGKWRFLSEKEVNFLQMK